MVNKIVSRELVASNFKEHLSLEDLSGLADRVRENAAQNCWRIYKKWEALGDVSGLEWIPRMYEER